MLFLTHGEVMDGKAKVLAVIYKTEELSEEMKATGVFVESIPDPAINQGLPMLMVNPETKDLWYEYQPIPETPLYPPTKEGQMQKEIDDLKLLIAELIAGGAV